MGWVTEVVPGEYTVHDHGFTVAGNFGIGTAGTVTQGTEAVLAGVHPYLDAGVRACVSHHATYGSYQPYPGTTFWVPGMGCPTPTPLTSNVPAAIDGVGWMTHTSIPILYLLPSHYTVFKYQTGFLVNPVDFVAVLENSPQWLAAAKAIMPTEWPDGLKQSMALMTARPITCEASITFGVKGFSGNTGLTVDAYRYGEYAAYPLMPTCIFPGDYTGSQIGSMEVTGTGPQVTADLANVLETFSEFVFLSPLAQSGVDLGYALDDDPEAVAFIGVMDTTVTFSASVRYFEEASVVPPLHATQRRGGADAHAFHARGADTRQSRFLARGPL